MDDQRTICRTCLEVVDNFSYIEDEISDSDSNKNNIRAMIQLCMPELDLYVSTQPLICNDCLSNLSNFYTFKSKCLETENKIHAYIQQNNLVNYSYVNLNCVLDEQLKYQNSSHETLQNGFKQFSKDNFNLVLNGIVTTSFRPSENTNTGNAPAVNNVANGASLEITKCPPVSSFFIADLLNSDNNRIQLKRIPGIVLVNKDATIHNIEKDRSEQPIVTHLNNNDNNSVLLSCPECSYVTTSQQKLDEHVCSMDKEYKCHICPYVTRRRHQLKKHINSVHTKSVWYFCDNCSYKCTDTSSLRRHKKCMHSTEMDVMYQCHLCSYRAATEFLYKKHMSKHNERTMLSCEYCSYETKDRSNFKKHGYIHNTDKPIKCEVCGYQCVSPYQMRRHIKKNHEGVSYNASVSEGEVVIENVPWMGHDGN